MCIAEVTAGAFFGCHNDRDMEGLIELENLCGAKFHANVAALTPVGINKDLPARAFFLGLAGRPCNWLGTRSNLLDL